MKPYNLSNNIASMGFEQAIPPVPDRMQEKEGMKRLEQNWLGQKYYKYYMNESVRVPKMAYVERLNKCYSEMYFKIFVTAFATLPLLFMSRRFFVSQGNIPTTKQADTFNRIRPDNFIRSWKYLKIAFPIYLASSIGIGMLWTDWSPIYDRYYSYTNKTTKMI